MIDVSAGTSSSATSGSLTDGCVIAGDLVAHTRFIEGLRAL
jgi:hypothetical protein